METNVKITVLRNSFPSGEVSYEARMSGLDGNLDHSLSASTPKGVMRGIFSIMNLFKLDIDTVEINACHQAYAEAKAAERKVIDSIQESLNNLEGCLDEPSSPKGEEVHEEKAPELTPMLKSFYDLKKKHPDAVLLFRCGAFYETYCEDAKKIAECLGITLTSSVKYKDVDGKPLWMAGFPYHALDNYLPKMIRAGHRVAICDEIMDRKVTNAVKRGTKKVAEQTELKLEAAI